MSKDGREADRYGELQKDGTEGGGGPEGGIGAPAQTEEDVTNEAPQTHASEPSHTHSNEATNEAPHAHTNEAAHTHTSEAAHTHSSEVASEGPHAHANEAPPPPLTDEATRAHGSEGTQVSL